jgi:hypothetical protein
MMGLPNGAGAPRLGRPRGRGRMFRVSLDRKLVDELKRAAAVRGLAPEVLLNSISRVVLADGLINAVLDDLPAEGSGKWMT